MIKTSVIKDFNESERRGEGEDAEMMEEEMKEQRSSS